MAIDIEKYRNQQKQTAADAVKDLREAYAFISLTTNMPYVECEEVDYNDQIHLFARKEDAESMQKELEAKGDRVRILELKTVEIQVPAESKKSGGGEKDHVSESGAPASGNDAVYWCECSLLPLRQEARKPASRLKRCSRMISRKRLERILCTSRMCS